MESVEKEKVTVQPIQEKTADYADFAEKIRRLTQIRAN